MNTDQSLGPGIQNPQSKIQNLFICVHLCPNLLFLPRLTIGQHAVHYGRLFAPRPCCRAAWEPNRLVEGPSTVGWFRRIAHKVRTARPLSRSDWGVFFQAWFLLLGVDLGLRLLPFPW